MIGAATYRGLCTVAQPSCLMHNPFNGVESAVPDLRAYAYIDAAYIRSGLERIKGSWQTLDLRRVALVALQTTDPTYLSVRVGIARVWVYDAIPSGEAESEVSEWLDANEALQDTHVRRGFLAGDPRGRIRQKAVDVRLAVDAMSAAQARVFDVGLLVTGDGDFAPLVEGIRQYGPLVVVAAFSDQLSDELVRAADRIGYLPLDPVAWQGWQLAPRRSSG